MDYFKNQSGLVFAFPDGTVPPEQLGLVAMSLAEIDQHLNPQPTPQQLQQMVGAAVDQMLDELARAWRYQNSTRLLAAKGSSNAKYAAEGSAFEGYWSECWATLDSLEASVLAGTAQMPSTVEEVLALLPAPPDRPGV